MHSLLAKRIEVPVLKGTAVVLTLPSWAFIIISALDRSQIGHHFWRFVLTGAGCGLCSSTAIGLFICMRGNHEFTRSNLLFILWVALPLLLIPLFGCLWVLNALVRF
jgi:hypothetical protein